MRFPCPLTISIRFCLYGRLAGRFSIKPSREGERERERKAEPKKKTDGMDGWMMQHDRSDTHPLFKRLPCTALYVNTVSRTHIVCCLSVYVFFGGKRRKNRSKYFFKEAKELPPCFIAGRSAPTDWKSCCVFSSCLCIYTHTIIEDERQFTFCLAKIYREQVDVNQQRKTPNNFPRIPMRFPFFYFFCYFFGACRLTHNVSDSFCHSLLGNGPRYRATAITSNGRDGPPVFSSPLRRVSFVFARSSWPLSPYRFLIFPRNLSRFDQDHLINGPSPNESEINFPFFFCGQQSCLGDEVKAIAADGLVRVVGSDEVDEFVHLKRKMWYQLGFKSSLPN